MSQFENNIPNLETVPNSDYQNEKLQLTQQIEYEKLCMRLGIDFEHKSQTIDNFDSQFCSILDTIVKKQDTQVS